MTDSSTAPDHLSEASRQWWESVRTEYELADHELRLLTAAASAWDRLEEARQLIASYGAYYDDRFGQPRAHPAVAVERDSRIAYARLIRELNLEVRPPVARPPALRYQP